MSASFDRFGLVDELDLVAGWVLDERDDGRSMLHRAWLADDLVAERTNLLAGTLDVVGPERDVPESITKIVALAIPIVGELDDGVRGLIAIADEAERELSVRVLLLPEDPHS